MKCRFIKKITLPVILLLSMVTISFAGEAQNVKEAFAEGDVSGFFKTIWFQRDYDDGANDWQSAAVGGVLSYETSPLKGFSMGVGFKTGQGGSELNSSSNEVYRGVLAMGDTKTDHESYTALNEYFLKFEGWDTVAVVGAQYLTTPWLKGHDVRLTPKTYQGVSIINKSIEKLEFHGYYLWKWMDWASEEWESMAQGITNNEGDDGDSIIGGILWRAPGDLQFELWDYYYTEVMNDIYLRGRYRKKYNDKFNITIDARYLNQRDVGDALDGSIDTYTTGAIGSLSCYGTTLSAYYGVNGSDAIRAPFGNHHVICMQYKKLDRGEEDAWALRLKYDFGHIGVKGLSAYVFYGSFDTPDSGDNASPDIDEIDFDVQYKFGGIFKNLSLRLRYAIINGDEDVAGGKDWTDSRTYLTYRF